MTERGLPSAEGAPACPFVAFEDDREARATSPDHRHRCYAEPLPLPRAAAHQEAYCLSSAFPVCPTFQDWARREAAHARGEGDRPRAAPRAQPETADRPEATPEPGPERDLEDERPRRGAVGEPPIRRNPPRDWAAPPPWASGAAGPGSAGATRRSPGGEPAGTPDFLAGRADESRGLAGSAADRLAAGAAASSDDDGALLPFDPAGSTGPDAELAGLVSGRSSVERPSVERPAHDHPAPSRPARRPTVSSTRTSNREPDRDAVVGPAWERARRYEAYPTIRARTRLSAPPRMAVLAGALVIAAVVLFFLPALLGVGGGGGKDTTTPVPSASQGAPTASPSPTAPAAPTPQVYVIKKGDTLSKVAKSFGLTLAELLDANKDTITDPDKIQEGDPIIIPAKPPDEFTEPSAGPSAKPS